MVKYDCTREQESEKSQTLAVIFKISILAHTQSFILMSSSIWTAAAAAAAKSLQSCPTTSR